VCSPNPDSIVTENSPDNSGQASTDPNSSSNAEKFPHRAAKLSMLSIVFLILAGVASRTLKEGGMSAGTVDWIRLGIVVVGFLFALVALAGIRSHGTRGLLGRGLAGFLAHGLLIFIFATNFMAARRKAQQEVAEVQELKNVSGQYMNEQLANTNLNDMDRRIEDVGKLGAKLEQTAQSSSGNAQKVAAGMAAFVKRLKTSLSNYEAASQEFDVDATLEFSEVKSVDELKRRRLVVEEFLKQNAALQALYENLAGVMHEELEKTGMDKIQLNQVIAAAKSRDQTINQIQVAMRKNDATLGAAAIGMIDVLEAHWGKWTWVKDQEAVAIEVDTARDQYVALAGQLNAASENMRKLNEKLMAAREAELERRKARK
jgi:hypothetical protein